MIKKLLIPAILLLGLFATVYLVSKIAEYRSSASGTTPMLYFTDATGTPLDTKTVVVGDEVNLFLTIDSIDKPVSQVVLRSTYDANKLQIVPQSTGGAFALGEKFDSKYAESYTGGNLKAGFVISREGARPTGLMNVASFKVKILALPVSITVAPAGESGTSVSSAGEFIGGLEVKSLRFVAQGEVGSGNPNPTGPTVSFSARPTTATTEGGVASFDLVGKIDSTVRLGSFRLVLNATGADFNGTVKADVHSAVRAATNVSTSTAGTLVLDYNEPQGTNRGSLPSGEFVLAKIHLANFSSTTSVPIVIKPESEVVFWTGADFQTPVGATISGSNFIITLTPSTTGALRGSFDTANCDSIWGWAQTYPPARAGTTIEILVDGEPRDILNPEGNGGANFINADQFRSDLGGTFGFSFNTRRISPSVLDGKKHRIQARATYDGQIKILPDFLGDQNITCQAPDNNNPGTISFKVAFGGLSDGSDSGQCGAPEPVTVKIVGKEGETPETRVDLVRDGSVCRVADDAGNCELALQVFRGTVTLPNAQSVFTNGALLIRGQRHLQMKYGQEGQSEYYNKKLGELMISKGASFDFSKYPILAGDVNGDAIVNGLDYGQVVDLFGRTNAGSADLDYSCQVNAQDLNLVKITLNERQSQQY